MKKFQINTGSNGQKCNFDLSDFSDNALKESFSTVTKGGTVNSSAWLEVTWGKGAKPKEIAK